MKQSILVELSTAICCFGCGTAFAQAVAKPEAASESPSPAKSAEAVDAGSTLEQIIVTAQRREQKLQDVPIAITAVTADQLQDFKIEDGFGLVKVAPGLVITRAGGGFAAPFIRGVGSSNIGVGDEPSVATYVDGFYRGPPASSALPFNNIDHVEVLKGPQGTLYGRNATGGLINIITRKPSDFFFAEVSGGMDSYETYEATGYVTGPVGDAMRADLAVTYKDQNRGVARNLTTGNRVGEEDGMSVRTKIDADLSDDTSLTFSADYSRTMVTIGSAQSIYPGTVPITALVGGEYSTTPYQITNNVDPNFELKAYGATVELRSELGDVEFVSMSQYRGYKLQLDLDLDGSSADAVPFVRHPTLGGFFLPTATLYTTYKLPRFITQEFQLQSTSQGPLSWIVGAFGLNSEESHDPLFLTAAVDGPPLVTIVAANETSAAAAFAQGTYDFDNGLAITAGGRYSYEKRETDGRQTAGGLTTTTNKAESFDAFTYRLAADYKATADLLLYVSASKGFKSGSFVVATIDNEPPVDPETLYAYEVGFKADFSATLRINGSAYYYDYKDMQFFVTSPAGLGSLQNAASATLYGVELELEARPLERLTLRAAGAWEHARYGHFDNAQVFVEAPPAGGRQVRVDVTGNQLIRAPEYTVSAGFRYEVPLPNDGAVGLSGNVYYNDGYPFDPAGEQWQKAYWLADASLAWTLPGGNWTLTAWGKNLFDELYIDTLTTGTRNVRVAYAIPRTVGLTVGFKFQ